MDTHTVGEVEYCTQNEAEAYGAGTTRRPAWLAKEE